MSQYIILNPDKLVSLIHYMNCMHPGWNLRLVYLQQPQQQLLCFSTCIISTRDVSSPFSVRFVLPDNIPSAVIGVRSLLQPDGCQQKVLVATRWLPAQCPCTVPAEVEQCRICRWWLLGTSSAWNVQDVNAKYPSNPAKFKDLIS